MELNEGCHQGGMVKYLHEFFWIFFDQVQPLPTSPPLPFVHGTDERYLSIRESVEKNPTKNQAIGDTYML